jgi:hypothetical protein
MAKTNNGNKDFDFGAWEAERLDAQRKAIEKRSAPERKLLLEWAEAAAIGCSAEASARSEKGKEGLAGVLVNGMNVEAYILRICNDTRPKGLPVLTNGQACVTLFFSLLYAGSTPWKVTYRAFKATAKMRASGYTRNPANGWLFHLPTTTVSSEPLRATPAAIILAQAQYAAIKGVATT